MLDMTDRDLRAAGWRWALRDPHGELLAVTRCPEDVGEWDRRYGRDYSIRTLHHFDTKED